MTAALTVIGCFALTIWALAALLLIRICWLNRQRDRLEELRHVDVDQLAKRARAHSARAARVERWHDVPAADEWGV